MSGTIFSFVRKWCLTPFFTAGADHGLPGRVPLEVGGVVVDAPAPGDAEGVHELLHAVDSGRVRAVVLVLEEPDDAGHSYQEVRVIAGRVGGMVQDERGIALGTTRATQLRAEAAAYRPAATGS